MGINLGDIIIKSTGTNVAARVEQIAEPRTVCISGKVFGEVERKLQTSSRPRLHQRGRC